MAAGSGAGSGRFESPLSRLKAELRIAGKKLPLDVLYMLPAEAEEAGFVTREGCVPLGR
jgi:hypothetical protein